MTTHAGAAATPEQEEATARKFYGTWRLAAVTRENPATGEKLDLDVAYDGYIAYTPDRRVTVIITRKPPNGERHITCYGARWTLDGDNVVHHVDIGTREGRSGTQQVRRFSFEGDRLTLTPPLSSDYAYDFPTQRSLIWRRVAPPR
jgi:Lipocalin-like domain